jgi:hypothetical protein
VKAVTGEHSLHVPVKNHLEKLEAYRLFAKNLQPLGAAILLRGVEPVSADDAVLTQ